MNFYWIIDEQTITLDFYARIQSQKETTTKTKENALAQGIDIHDARQKVTHQQRIFITLHSFERMKKKSI